MRHRLIQHPLLEQHTEELVFDLQEKACILLSLLAWHFDPQMASVSIGLLRFFDQPWAQLSVVCKGIYPIYRKLHRVESEQRVEKDLRRLMELLPRVVVSKLLGLE